MSLSQTRQRDIFNEQLAGDRIIEQLQESDYCLKPDARDGTFRRQLAGLLRGLRNGILC